MNFLIKRHYICSTVFFSVTITFFLFININSPVYRLNVDKRRVKDNISCHYITEGDSLPPAETLSPLPDSIFFHETSCRGGLSSRQACSIESAARLHPARYVYVFFNSPITAAALNSTTLAKLTHFSNVILARVHTTDYAKNTILAEILTRERIGVSDYPIVHISDMLRFITLYKYGGVYLDTDVIVVKPLDNLGRNWAAREDDSFVNVAAIAFGKDELGQSILKALHNEIKSNFRPHVWGHQGPGAMTKVLQNFCKKYNTLELSGATCKGFEVYNPDVIYPIHYNERNKYFEPGDLQHGEKAFIHHLWNGLTRYFEIKEGCPYQKLAKQYCPTIYSLFGNRFGL